MLTESGLNSRFHRTNQGGQRREIGIGGWPGRWKHAVYPDELPRPIYTDLYLWSIGGCSPRL
jgi:hypothetical protein